MLKEIICDKLPNRQIVFHEGLNVIEGDENAANSIGKSSALLLRACRKILRKFITN